MKYANEEELSAVVDYVYAFGGEVIDVLLRHQPGWYLLQNKLKDMGFSPEKLTKRDTGKRMLVEGGYALRVKKGEHDFVLRDKQQAREWAINKAVELRTLKLNDNANIREMQLFEARGQREVETVEQQEELGRYRQWLTLLPLPEQLTTLSGSFEIKTMVGTPMERAKLNNYALARGVKISIVKSEKWLIITAVYKEKKQHNFPEFDKLKVGESFFYKRDQVERRKFEFAVVRFNRTNTEGKRLSWNQSFEFSVTRIL